MGTRDDETNLLELLSEEGDGLEVGDSLRSEPLLDFQDSTIGVVVVREHLVGSEDACERNKGGISARSRVKDRRRVERTVALDVEVSEDIREGVLRERKE